MKKYVLFDLDGTLTDPETGITLSVAYSLESFGIHVDNPKELRKFIGPPLKESYMEFFGFSEKDALSAVDKYRERFSVTGIFENKPYDGIYELLEQLRSRGFTLAVASSKPEIYTKQIIEHFNMNSYFSAVCGSELDGRRTNKAEVISYALEKLGFPHPETVIMVGDRSYDILGAKQNSLSSIGVLYGFGSKEELTEAGADYIVSAPCEISELI